MALNANFPELATTTLNLWVNKDFADAFTSHSPIWYRLREKGNIVTGGLGLKALEPLMYPSVNAPQQIGVTSGYNTITPTPTEGWTNAEFEWSEQIMDVSIEMLDLEKQGSDTRRLDHLGALKDNRMMGFNEGIISQLWRAPSLVGANGASRAFFGSLRCYFNRGNSGTPASVPAPLTEQTGASVESSLTTVGNIDRTVAASAYFCTPIDTSTLSVTLENTQRFVSLATRGKDVPDLIGTTKTNYNTLAGVLMALQRYRPGSLADAGFRGTMDFDGCDVFWDDNMPAANIFVFNTDYIKLRTGTMKPKFTLSPDAARPRLMRWCLTLVGQMTSGHLGRVHSRGTVFGS